MGDKEVFENELQWKDNEDDFQIQLLKVCQDYDGALQIFKKYEVDLIIIDVERMKIEAFKLIDEIQKLGYQLPTIILHDFKDSTRVSKVIEFKQLYARKNNGTKDVNFRIRRQKFMTDFLTGELKEHYNKIDLAQTLDQYHLLKPRLSLYRLRFSHMIDAEIFTLLNEVIKDSFPFNDYDAFLLTEENLLVILYEEKLIEEYTLMDAWLRLKKKIKETLKIDIQVSKRFIIDSVEQFLSCEKMFQRDYTNHFIDRRISDYREEVELVLHYIHDHYHEKIKLGDLSTFVCLNEAYLSRLFKIETKKTISSYMNELRMCKAKELLQSPNIRIKEVAQLVGIKDQLYFNRVFKKYCGENPTDYQERVKKIRNIEYENCL
ncbi:MAG: helix-turn-helix domain-containing protein [Turicibacter sp.]|nr:helix-turn-helix domain-containing protein [Turicibacter sp.]